MRPRPSSCLCAAAALVLAACSEVSLEPGSAVRRAPLTGAMVTLLNDGAVTLSNVRVITSSGDSIPLVASLPPGARVGPHAVAALHTNPFVSATAQGRNVVAQPVEGFSGFNPRLSSGFYSVRLRHTLDGILDVRVQKDDE